MQLSIFIRVNGNGSRAPFVRAARTCLFNFFLHSFFSFPTKKLSEHGGACHFGPLPSLPWPLGHELELELIQTQMAQKPMLRAEVGMRVRCANKASAELFRRERGIGQIPRKIYKKRGICGCCALRRTIKRKAREQRSS